MKWVYALLVLSLALCGLAALLAYSGLFVLDESGGSAQFIAAAAFLMATAGWIVNNAVSLRLKMRENSLKYLEVVTSRNDQAANLNKLWMEFRVDDILTDQPKLEKFFIDNSLDHPLFNSLRLLANSYEEMAVALKVGAVEDKVVRRVFATSFLWFWGRLAPFLPLYRNIPALDGNPRGPHANPKIFSHCEWLASTWHGREL